MTRRRAACIVAVIATLGLSPVGAAGGAGSITAVELKDWLTYIASDELEGRAVFTEGLGLAAGFIQTHLQEWRVKPAGDGGSYIQTVKVQGIKATSRSTVTVHVGHDSRTFKDGAGITFPRNAGGARTLTLDRVEFAGYGLHAPGANHVDFAGNNVQGAAVVFLGQNGPKGLDAQSYRRVLAGRSRYATDQLRAAAAIGPSPSAQNTAGDAPAAAAADGANSAGGASDATGGNAANGASRADGATAANGAAQAGRGGRGGARPANAPDFTTTQRLDLPVPPAVSGSDAFFTFLFSAAPVHYDELRRRALDQDALPRFRLEGVTLTFNIDVDYTVVRTQLTQNVVGMVEGSDSTLRSTYVAFGAHYDHVGYADSEVTAEGRRPSAPGRVTPGAIEDRIWNGADDDGSGTVALMALARAFAEGSRPKRSLLFVWHAGEERGLWGSRYFVDHPTVPLDRVVAQLNIDMIGRNRDNLETEANTVYLVGSDRISSELHQVSRAADAALRPPLTLNYEMNDPADVEQVYYRSDHYSYAAKGIPIIFFTTGLHPDYHANTDDVSKIEFAKMTRVAQLVYETGRRVADLDHPPARDYQGPRAGKGTP